MAKKIVLTNCPGLMLVLIVVTAAIGISGCVMIVPEGERHGSEGITTSRGEHERENGAGNGESSEVAGASDSEESGTTLTLTERYDTVRKGARLILVYDADSNTFTGTVENTTSGTLQQVRVEVHLSNGVELGPPQRRSTSAPVKSWMFLSQQRTRRLTGGPPTLKLGREAAAKMVKTAANTVAAASETGPKAADICSPV